MLFLWKRKVFNLVYSLIKFYNDETTSIWLETKVKMLLINVLEYNEMLMPIGFGMLQSPYQLPIILC